MRGVEAVDEAMESMDLEPGAAPAAVAISVKAAAASGGNDSTESVRHFLKALHVGTPESSAASAGGKAGRLPVKVQRNNWTKDKHAPASPRSPHSPTSPPASGSLNQQTGGGGKNVWDRLYRSTGATVGSKVQYTGTEQEETGAETKEPSSTLLKDPPSPNPNAAAPGATRT